VKVNIPIDPNSNIAFGPNDEFLVYSTEAQSGIVNQLIKFNLMDSTSQIIVGDTATQSNNPDVSQDGRMVIYSKSFNSAHRWTEIWLANIDGSNDHKIISGDHLDFDFPMWSPDDKYIVCSSSIVYDTFYGGYAVGTNIWLYDVVKDTTQQLLNINGYNTSWSKR
jgi:Tol biopolymer transport system component